MRLRIFRPTAADQRLHLRFHRDGRSGERRKSAELLARRLASGARRPAINDLAPRRQYLRGAQADTAGAPVITATFAVRRHVVIPRHH